MAAYPPPPPSLTTETSIIEEEGDVFEITDFTSATDWEQFMSELEEVFNEWKVDGGINAARFSVKSATGVESIPEAERTADSHHATAAAGSNATRRFGGDRRLQQQQFHKQHAWKDQSCTVRYMDCEFRLTHHCQVRPCKPTDDDQSDEAASATATERSSSSCWTPVLHQIASSEGDFPSVAHCLTRWFGLRELIVVKPSQDQTVCNESRLRLLLSSLCITAHNAGCQLPIFLQVGRPERRLYFGQAIGSGLRTRFEIAQLCKIPRHYRHLQGAIDMFRQRIACPGTASANQTSNGPSISAAIRLSYSLTQFSDRLLAYLSPLPETMRQQRSVGQQQRDLAIHQLDLPARLPIGACEEPISELQLAAVWPRLAEEMVVDTESYTDLDPLHAPVWTLRARFLNDALCRLADCLGRLLRLCTRRETVHDLLAALFTSPSSAAAAASGGTGVSGSGADGGSDGAKSELSTASRALDRLTGSRVPSVTDAATGVVRRATSKLSVRGDQSAPLSEAQLNCLLNYLFPDAAAAANPSQQPPPQPSPQYSERAQKLARDLKCAPLGSLAHRLALAVATLNHTHASGIHAVAHLWQEVVLELRYRWENSCPLPAAPADSASQTDVGAADTGELVETPPDLGTSLLHQKLQMLQLCIGRKLAREKAALTTPQQQAAPSVTDKAQQRLDEAPQAEDSAADGDEEEEDEEEEEEFFECQEEPDHQPDGRLRPLLVSAESGEEPVRLLKRPDRVLWIPATQQAPPMTEDSLEEHAELLAKLGTDSQAAALRARMQSSSLLSDMQAFKAANPGCCLEDFVRWHSPRDFSTGQLSARMQLAGNIWLETWQLARPIPARLQRRLFDDTKEVEKILQQLSALTPAEVAKLLLPNAILDGLASLVDLPADEAAMLTESAPQFQRTLESACEKACDATRERTANPERYESLVGDIAYLELQVVRLRSLLYKFNACFTPNNSATTVEASSFDPVTRQFLLDLLRQPEVSVIGASRGPIGSALQRMFVESYASVTAATVAAAASAATSSTTSSLSTASSANSSDVSTSKFPPFTAKEMLLRCVAPRPGPGSRPTPQRLYCVLAKDDYRFAGAFTEDTTFL